MKQSNNLKFREYDKKTIPVGGRIGMGYVYFISDGGFVKIGKSHKPKMRVCSIIYEMKIKSPKIFVSDAHSNYSENEKLLHELFSIERVKGEWFRLDIEKVAAENYTFLIVDNVIENNIEEYLDHVSSQVRLHPTTKASLDLQKLKINKAREKK